MKSIQTSLSSLVLFFCITLVCAQEKTPTNTADFKLGSGLNFSLNDGDYLFNIGGFLQPSANYEKVEGLDEEYEFNAKRSYFMISGTAVNEKVSFLFQTDFSLNQPLLDAWIAYHPYQWLTITGGQKQSFINNREMTYREDRLQFTDRGRLSQLYSNTGREFGVFIETRFGKTFGIAPKLAFTSGDGRNSFGSDSRDSDLGGFKLGARLDLYPLGYFTEGNDLYTADLAREETLKLLVGGSVSQNNGASSQEGEGHGEFFLYNNAGGNNLPDYSQVYVDVLLKYSGFSFLGEYANASASDIGTPFLDADATEILAPQQISEFLILGDSYSLQTGYVTPSGYSLDFRYENTSPEFEDNTNSLLPDSNSYTIGFTRYFDANNLKLQAAFTSIDFAEGANATMAELLFQIAF